MIRIRSALMAPFRLAPVDFFAAVSIAIIALSLIAGPAFSQDANPSLLPTASPIVADAPDAAPSDAATFTPSEGPAASPLVSLSPQASGAAELDDEARRLTDVGSAAASPGATLHASLAPGANSEGDPCAPKPTPSLSASPGPDASPGPSPTAAPPPNLCPARPDGANPLNLLAFLFTPIFQAIFLGLMLLYDFTGDIGIAIILLTIIIRTLMIPVFRAQITSQRRMQLVQPELRVIQQKYKGDRAKISQEQMKLYKGRGVNPASGCLPAALQMVLLLPMYQVFNNALKAPDISSMLAPRGFQVVDIECVNPGDPFAPCIETNIPWLGWIPKIDASGLSIPGYPGGLPSEQPEIFLLVFTAFGLGLSLLAATSAILQLIQTRMMMTRSDDPQQKTQQRIFLLLPAFSLVYGAILPAGLFIYWITTTIFSIVQQFLINGYGGLFPLFGWTPAFAQDHKPRFPVTLPEPKPQPAKEGGDGSTNQSTKRSTKESAAGTIRPARRRSRRRGRRR